MSSRFTGMSVEDYAHYEFQRMVGPEVDIRMSEGGNYITPTTQQMWKGFKLYLDRTQHKQNSHSRVQATDFLLVGRAEPHLSSQFDKSNSRFYHLDQAVEELEYLAALYPGQTFAIYRPIFKRRVDRAIREPVIGVRRLWPYVPSPYYEFQGKGDRRSIRTCLFLTDDFGNAVNPPILWKENHF